MKNKPIAVSVLLSVASTSLPASDLYLVGAIGRSHFAVEQGTIDGAIRKAGANGISSTTDKDDTAYKIQLGYRFNPYLAIEGGYVDLGKATYAARFDGGSATVTIRARGVNAAVLGLFPVNDSFTLFGKLGVINAKAETELRTTGLSASVNSTNLRANTGLGVTYNFGKAISGRFEYEEFYKLGDSEGGTRKVGLWSFAIQFKF